jgi:diguanylate cyclase (GGDEF)-like protein
MQEVAEDSLESTTLEGVPVLTVFSRSAVSNWTVAIGIPIRDVTSELGRLLWWLILGLAILLASSLALAWVIGGRIAWAVRGLCEPALALGRGEAATVPSLHLKEADEVGRALMKASRMLQEAQHLAHHDALTGLANRLLFTEIVDHHLSICGRTGSTLAVLYLDIDGFKAVNDAHGHATGDQLLRAVAARLKSGIRSSDVAARLSGDEFGILLVLAGPEGAANVARKLGARVSFPYPIDQLTIEISASIGVAAYPDSGTTSEELLRSADEAMYKAKADRDRSQAVRRPELSAEPV